MDLTSRSKTEIISQMLGAVSAAAAANDTVVGGGATKTQIMYKSFISFRQLNRYLSLLLENKLLVYDEKTTKYKITTKGLNFLKVYHQFEETNIYCQ